MELFVGQSVTLRPGVPKAFANLVGAIGVVAGITEDKRCPVATVTYDDHRILEDVPTAYLIPAPSDKPKRRSPLNLHEPKDERSEAERQREMVTWLAINGYLVLETGKARRMVKCEDCGNSFYPTGWQGNTPGCPDLFIHGLHWPALMWLGVDVKAGHSAEVRPEQKRLMDQKAICIVTNLPELRRLIADREEHAFGNKPAEEVKA
jgi:hypothetical protein